jgi:ABC-2 type transport system ATP-binding protein
MAFVTPPDLEAIKPMAVSQDDIIVQHVSKQFRDELAVNDASFQVPHASIFGFIGPSGSGKTTIVRMLTGVYTPTSGELTVLGKTPTHFTQRQRARLGYMPQLFVLYPHLTVWENLNFAASIYGVGVWRGRRLRSVLELVELYEHRHKMASQISGGMQRRLSLAATLIHNPELIFLDEPTAGIDPALRRKFWEHFKELQAEGRTLFITTQYVNEASYCDLVGVMSEGRLLVVDTPQGLRHRAYGGEVVLLQTLQPIDNHQEESLRGLPFTLGSVVRTSPNTYQVKVQHAASAIPELIEWGRINNVSIETAEEYVPPFDDVFIELVRKGTSHG